MAYRIKRTESPMEAIWRIADEQISKALEEIDNENLDRHEKVHQVRKRCKKIRGLIRLVRPAFEKTYQRENAHYRDAGRALSYIRDAHSIVETFDALLDHYQDHFEAQRFHSIRESLLRRRDEIVDDEVGIDERLTQFRRRMEQGRRRLEAWQLDKDGFASLSGGLTKTYRRACQAMRRAYRQRTADDFYQWRKRVKYHWYHARLLRSTWKPVVGTHRDAADELADILGEEHDLAVLGETLVEDAVDFGSIDSVEAFMAMADRRRVELRAAARRSARLLLAEKPRHFRRRWRKYWTVCREDSTPVRTDFDAHAAVAAV